MSSSGDGGQHAPFGGDPLWTIVGFFSQLDRIEPNFGDWDSKGEMLLLQNYMQDVSDVSIICKSHFCCIY